ncbi:MAG: methionyl-tRNA formyltransferase [Luteibaculaceae bacterium]
MRIIFFGTPEFAVESLRALVENKFTVVAVVTAPDKPAGRGRKLQEPDVKLYAKEQNLPILQPTSLKDEKFLQTLANFKADIFVVVAFRMLPEVVWNMPPLGSLNLHASYLPNYRGAAPINWVIINGEKETGISTFFLKHDIDTGDIILRKKLNIFEGETAGKLHDRLKEEGAKLLCETLQLVKNDKATPIPQEVLSSEFKKLNHAPKIFKNMCQIDWDTDGDKIQNKVRGLAPFPSAFSFLLTDEEDILIKFFEVKFEAVSDKKALPFPGFIDSNGKNELKIACKNGYIHLLELQMQGKKRMMLEEWLRGYTLPKTTQFFFKNIDNQ